MPPIRRIFVHGFPGLYGGAGTELHHQIPVWLKLGLEVHLIPNWSPQMEPLFSEMISLGVVIHGPNDFSSIEQGDPVISFCNGDFLNLLPSIRQKTKRTIFVNCMTWLFEKEKEAMASGEIAMFLYQNPEVEKAHRAELKAVNSSPDVQFQTFKPHFDHARFPFVEQRYASYFGCGRISRQDADKFAKETLHIYEYFVSPKWKQGLFLGFDHRSEEKIGKPFDWIRLAKDHTEVTPQDFYRHCEIVLQPSDTTENWPRIGFEAMSSGSVLIVDNRGGWKSMVKHGETGWLCDSPRDFIYYASKMAYEPNQRDDMAHAAKERGMALGGFDQSMESWSEILDKIQDLPA